MNIYDVDLKKLISYGLLQDNHMQQLCDSVNLELRSLMNDSKFAKSSYDVDNASENILQHIAWQLNSELFFVGKTLADKRKLVKEAIRLHRKKGTKYAVEHAIQLILPNAKVEEWFEYSGEPYHFRVINTEKRSLREILTVISLINIMKSLRSWIDNNFEAEDKGLIDLNLLFNFDTFMTASYKPNYYNSGDFITIGINTEWEASKDEQVIWIDNSNDILPEEFNSQTFFENYLEDNNLSYQTYNNYMIAEALYYPTIGYYLIQPFPTLNNIYLKTHFSNGNGLTYEDSPIWKDLLEEENLTQEEKETYFNELDTLTTEQIATWYIAVKTVKRFIESNNITQSAFNSYATSHPPQTITGRETAEQLKILRAKQAVNYYLAELDSWLLVEDEYIVEKTENATAIKDFCTKYLNLYKEAYLNE